MYNHHLDIFIKTADAGSFSKAGEQLFISPNAVMKQINTFEDHLGIKLFDRSSHGLRLTESGKVIYAEGKKMIAHSDELLSRLRARNEGSSNTVRVGTSVMRPARLAIELWRKVSPECPGIKLDIVPFEDRWDKYLSVAEHLGKDVDIICTNINGTSFDKLCNSITVKRNPIVLAVSPSSHLAGKDIIDPCDLHGDRLYILSRGKSSNVDEVRNYLEQKHPQIELVDIPDYDLDVLSVYADLGANILSYRQWEDVHPQLIIKEVNWSFDSGYGMLYPKNLSAAVRQYIEAVKKYIADNH